MEKLELKHLAPYLPYELKGKDIQEGFDGIREMNIKTIDYFLHNVKPILRPLSDLTNGKYYKCLEVLYSEEKIKRILNEHWCHWEYKVLILCFEEHIDVFGLIPKGLAISYSDVQSTSNEG